MKLTCIVGASLQALPPTQYCTSNFSLPPPTLQSQPPGCNVSSLKQVQDYWGQITLSTG